MEFNLRRLFPPEPAAPRSVSSSSRSVKQTHANDLSEKKLQFLELVRKLHTYYKDQADAALVSTRKFEQAIHYFIRALRRIKPSHMGYSFGTLRELETRITSLQEKNVDGVSDADNASDLHTLLQSFLKNITNFRILRQHVKMEILQTLKQLPEEYEDDLQTRTRGEMEVLLSAWAGLVNKDSDLTKLEHPSVNAYDDLILNEQERTCFCGVLSIIPKLIDIVNRFDFLLVKYRMGSSNT